MDIGSMTKEETIKAIINQANALNKKIKSFRKQGEEVGNAHYEYVTSLIGSEGIKYKEGVGTVTKSKKFYETVNLVQLKRNLKALHTVNNSEIFGTVRKFEKTHNRQVKQVSDYVRANFRGKGYSDDYINTMLGRADFFDDLFTLFNNMDSNFSSDTEIDKVLLNYGKGEFDNETMNIALNNMEYSRNEQIRNAENQKAFDEFMKMR